MLVTRPLAQAQRTAAALADLGYAPLVAPLMHILPTHALRPVAPFDALVIASAHAVPALVGEPSLKTLPAFAVGARSGEALRAAGFTDVRTGNTDRHGLAQLLSAQIAAPARILAVLGEDHHADWLDDLTRSGRAVTRWISYRAVAVPNLSPEAGEAWGSGQIAAVLHFSARQAELFVAALDNRGALDKARRANGSVHVVLSQAVAAPLRTAGIGPLIIAAKPDETAVLAALQSALTKGGLPRDAAKFADRSAAVCLALDTKTALNAGTISRTQGAAHGRAARHAQEASAIMSDADKTGARAQATASGQTASAHAATRKGQAAVQTSSAATSTRSDAASDAPETPSPAQKIVLPEQVELSPALETAPPTMTEAAAPATTQAPPRTGFGMLALLLAGLVGGTVSAGAVLFAPRLIPGLGTASQPANPSIALLEREIAALKTASSASAAKADAAAQGVKQLQSAPAPAAGAPAPEALTALMAPQIGPLAERLARLEAAPAIAAAKANADSQSLTQRLGAVEQTLKNPHAPSSAASAAARLVLIDRVRLALDAGRGFEADLAALAGTGLAPDALKPLDALAKGAPTRAALREQVRQNRRVMAEDTAATSTSWSEKLLQLSDSIVQVRRVDDASAVTPAGLTAAIEQALATGDSAAAAAAWAKLPEPARRATALLGTQLGQRAAADASLKSMGDAAVTALAGR